MQIAQESYKEDGALPIALDSYTPPQEVQNKQSFQHRINLFFRRE